jgi:intein/homing endonuclease
MTGILEQENGTTQLNQAQDLNSGFVGGVLVHTDKGLVKISDIKVGDLVLSKDQNNHDDELVYKPVVRIVEAENVPVYFASFTPAFVDNLRFRERMNPSLYADTLCTENHPFWVESRGWIRADQLLVNDNVLLKNGVTAYFSGGSSENRRIDVVFKTDQQNIGYIPDFHSDMNKGRYIDLETGRTLSFDLGYEPVFRKLFIEDTEWRERLLAQTPVEFRDHAEFYGFRHGFWKEASGIEWAEGEGPVTAMIYNIEVADTHTYFVSEQGVWVKAG